MKKTLTLLLLVLSLISLSSCKKEEIIESFYLGRYPQTKVEDEELCNSLKQISETNDNGYIVYENNEYLQIGSTYYIVEDIKWIRYVGFNNKVYYISEKILDAYVFLNEDYFTIDAYSYITKDGVPKNIHANNYYYSDLREWLNTSFLINAFNSEELTKIKKTTLDNSETTGMSNTKYVCENTEDYILTLSYQDMVNQQNIAAKTTDYAIYKGVETYHSDKTDDILDGNGLYWLRSSNNYYSYCSCGVNYQGLVLEYINCHYIQVGVRPAIVI